MIDRMAEPAYNDCRVDDSGFIGKRPMSDSSTVMLHIPFSKDLAALLGTQNQAAEKAREWIILGLYQENRISGGKAAELLGLTRLGFVSLLTRKGIDYFQLSAEEWAEEVAIVEAWSANCA